MTTKAVADQQGPTAAVTTPPMDRADTQQPATLVWVDTRVAVLVHWLDGETRVERMRSHVPPRHRGTGHVRHRVDSGHGVGGPQVTAAEHHRLELLGRFVTQVAEHLPVEDTLLILGPGMVRQRLEHEVTAADQHHRRSRTVTCRPAPRMSEPRLIEQLHDFVGVPARRRTSGAYRWSEGPSHRPSGQAVAVPRRVPEKPAPRADEWDT